MLKVKEMKCVCRLKNGKTKCEAGTSKTKTGPSMNRISKILKNVLTFSTSSVVNRPLNLYFCKIKSGLNVLIIIGESKNHTQDH